MWSAFGGVFLWRLIEGSEQAAIVAGPAFIAATATAVHGVGFVQWAILTLIGGCAGRCWAHLDMHDNLTEPTKLASPGNRRCSEEVERAFARG